VTRSPSPEPVRKDKKRKKSHNKRPDKENREEAFPVRDAVFTRKREDGSTSLAILNPGEGVIPGTERDRPVSLGNYLGKVRYGAASIQGFKEDRRNQAKPMYPIFYPGGYSSHGPTFDSTFANLTPEDSKMVAPYYDQRKVTNGEIDSLCGEDYSEHLVDSLLSVLTGDMSSPEKIVTHGTEDKAIIQSDEEINFDHLSTLESDGIDMSWLSSLQTHYELRQEPEMEGLSVPQQLELTAQLIKNLQAAQLQRISAPPPANLSALPPPTQREMKLAERLVTGLTRLTGQVSPGQVSSGPEVRRALGVVTPAPGEEESDQQAAPGLSNGHALHTESEEVTAMET